jgi:fatty-acyl-CoA synthase
LTDGKADAHHAVGCAWRRRVAPINPRLALDDIAYIINHAEDVVLFVDTSFAALATSLAPLVRDSVRTVVTLTDTDAMPDVTLAPGMRLACYETLMAETDAGYAWPTFDANTASALCYTSGTTGRPKGVLCSHRSTVIHALAANQADVFGLRATDRLLLCTPMFHACGSGSVNLARSRRERSRVGSARGVIGSARRRF